VTPAPAGDSPYLSHTDYWVAADQAHEYPVRQGDLFANVEIDGGLRLDAALIIHPTCELGKASVANIQVAPVRSLESMPDQNQRQKVVAGISEKDGKLRVAFAHTFFVAPAANTQLDGPMWADLRDLPLAPREQFTIAARVAALTHDARVTLIRRYVYFRFRWSLTFNRVRGIEARRIAADPAFAGPRPQWATSLRASYTPGKAE
jgi:hypothetical protein